MNTQNYITRIGLIMFGLCVIGTSAYGHNPKPVQRQVKRHVKKAGGWFNSLSNWYSNSTAAQLGTGLLGLYLADKYALGGKAFSTVKTVTGSVISTIWNAPLTQAVLTNVLSQGIMGTMGMGMNGVMGMQPQGTMAQQQHEEQQPAATQGFPFVLEGTGEF